MYLMHLEEGCDGLQLLSQRSDIRNRLIVISLKDNLGYLVPDQYEKESKILSQKKKLIKNKTLRILTHTFEK